MLIDFKNMDFKENPSFKGGEKSTFMKLFSDSALKIINGRLEPGATIGYHIHENDCEVVYILKGNGSVDYNGEIIELPEGSCHYCPKGMGHSLRNTGDEELFFLGVVPNL